MNVFFVQVCLFGLSGFHWLLIEMNITVCTLSTPENKYNSYIGQIAYFMVTVQVWQSVLCDKKASC